MAVLCVAVGRTRIDVVIDPEQTYKRKGVDQQKGGGGDWGVADAGKKAVVY